VSSMDEHKHAAILNPPVGEPSPRLASLLLAPDALNLRARPRPVSRTRIV
jgi:hypothetical protein